MNTFNPDQALARWIELWEKRHEEFDQLPDLLIREPDAERVAASARSSDGFAVAANAALMTE